MQNPLRDENPVVGSNPAPPNNRVTKKATKHRSGKSNPIQNVPPPPPEDAVPSNGVDYALVTNLSCTIPGNEWTGYIEIDPLDDTVTEGTESVGGAADSAPGGLSGSNPECKGGAGPQGRRQWQCGG